MTLHALLFWPDSPRRGKVVRDLRTEEVVAAVPGLPPAFVGPKETAILDLCRQEQAAGRKVLLLCLQTDTLDIQPEWQQLLAGAGLKAAVLRAAPNQREGWVARQVADGVDVVITHPKKVETGLDLLDFPTIVWMAPHYSVYTVLQASRRSWRIGQTQPVKVYYYAYADTIQTDALYLVAAKVAAALRVNGDSIADTSLAELDTLAGEDIVATLARIVTGDSELTTASLQQAFADANAALRQANVVIGEYAIADEPDDAVSDAVVIVAGNDHVTTTPPTDIRQPPPTLPANGHARQPQLLGNGAAPHTNGVTHADPARQPGSAPTVSTNGHVPADRPAEAELDAPLPPPAPRPRLIIRR